MEHFKRMKNGAIIANAGHFNVEIDLMALENWPAKREKSGSTSKNTSCQTDGVFISWLKAG